jgi:hypothetical protein
MHQRAPARGVGAGQDAGQNPGCAIAATAGAGSRPQQLAHLGADPFARNRLYSSRKRGTGGQPLGVPPWPGRHSGVKAEEAQDAQIILADAGFGIADKPHAAGQQVGQGRPSGSITVPSARHKARSS